MNKLFLISLCLLLAKYSAFAEPLITLPNGQIRGHELKTPQNKSFYAFQGVPFAAPPTGELRFQAPIPPDNWTGILDATKEAKYCISDGYTTSVKNESEDCLYVNVYTPVLNPSTDETKLPVMLWIYGGAFIQGSSMFSFYGPHFIVDQDVIMVSFNYRLGPFGFLSTSDEVIPGNAGLKDQNLALKWTYENIEFFGGDPNKITVFGQSAGGTSTCLHILSSLSTDLFRSAICESGSAVVPWALELEPAKYAYSLVQTLNGTTADDGGNITSQSLLNFLKDISPEEIIVASNLMRGQNLIWTPVLETNSEGAFLSKGNYNYGVLESGKINNVSLMIGITSEEYLGLIDLDTARLYGAYFDTNDSTLIPADLKIEDEQNVPIVGKSIKEIYLDGNDSFTNNVGAVIRFLSDTGLTRGVIKHAELQSKYTDVYFYQFSYKGLMGYNNFSVEGAEKVGHSEELFYIFRHSILGVDNADPNNFPKEDVLTQQRLLKLWTDFAKTTNPTPEKSELLQNITWPTVHPQKFQYLDIGENLEVKTNPKETTYKGWSEIYEKWGTKPFVTF